MDGDAAEEFDELDPIPTDWNSLIRPAQAKRLRLAFARARSPTTIPSIQEQPQDSPISTVRRPVPVIPSVRSLASQQFLVDQVYPLQETPTRHSAPQLYPTPSVAPSSAPSSSSSSPGATVTIVHENGISEQVRAIAEPNNNTTNRNQNKRKSKKVIYSDFCMNLISLDLSG